MTKRFWRNNSLSIAMFGIFFVTIVGMSVAGWQSENNERNGHGQPAQSYGQYVASGGFVEAVFENWQSEFLAVGTLMVLSIYLRERGSTESKPVGKRFDHKTGE